METKKEIKMAKIWCELNRWNWPKELSEYKPIWWDNSDRLRAEVERKIQSINMVANQRNSKNQFTP